MKTGTVYSEYFVSRPSDWQEADSMVGPIVDVRHDCFESPAPIVHILKQWKSKKIINVGMGSVVSYVMFDTNVKMQFLINI